MHKVGFLIKRGDVIDMRIGRVDWGRVSVEMSKYIGVDHRTKKQNEK